MWNIVTCHSVKKKWLLIAGVLILVSSCTKPPRPIGESFTLDQDGGYLTGAKSRVILAHDPSAASRPGAIYPRRITCVEPHPDVASTIANSLGVGISVLAERPASFSESQAEGLAQIAQRTASIQTLQRLMFRACEAYANGAITGTGYSLLLSEVNKTMVTLILAETAGGRFGQSGAAIGGKSTATASAKVDELEAMLKELQASVNTVGKVADELQDSTEEAKTTVSTAVADGAVTTTEAQAIDDAKEQVEQDTEDLADATRRLRRVAEVATATSAEITKVEGLGGLSVTPNPEVASTLATMQDNFLSSGTTQNYISACLVELGMGSQPTDFSDIPPAYRAKVNRPLLKRAVQLEEAQSSLEKEKSELQEAQSGLEKEKSELRKTQSMLEKDKLELQKARSKLEASVASGSTLAGKIKSKDEEIKSKDEEIKSKDEEIKSKDEEIKSKEKSIEENERKAKDMANETRDIWQFLSSSTLAEVQRMSNSALKALAKDGKISFGDLRAFVYRVYHFEPKNGPVCALSRESQDVPRPGQQTWTEALGARGRFGREDD